MPATTRRRRPPPPEQIVLERAQRDPDWFMTEVLGIHLWSAQRKVAHSVRDHRKTAVRSGHGTGKTYSAAAIALWFLYSFPDSRVVTTATKWSQVRDLLWRDLNRLHAAARYPLGGTCLQTRLDIGDGRFAIGLTSRRGNEESFAGHHAPRILLIFDEASGVLPTVYEVGEGYMTTPGARWLLIGNPTRSEGEFHAAFHAKRGEYALHHIPATSTPNFTNEPCPADVAMRLTGPQWVEEMGRYEGTAIYDVRVLGDFARQADDAVISLGDIEDAQTRDLDPDPDASHAVAVDVARFGSDETVISTRQDHRVRIARVLHGKATTETAGAALEQAAQIGADRIVVDDPGVGGGVTDILKERIRERGLDVKVEPFNGANKALDPERYPNARSELWFTFAEEHLPDLDLDADDQLAADLVAPRFKLDSAARRTVEPKEQTKKRLGRSPDRGDSVLLLYAPRRRKYAGVW